MVIEEKEVEDLEYYSIGMTQESYYIRMIYQMLERTINREKTSK